MIDKQYIIVGLMFMCACCGLFIGYTFGKVQRHFARRHDDPPDWPEPEGDFDGGYAAMHAPRRLTRLTSRTTEN